MKLLIAADFCPNYRVAKLIDDDKGNSIFDDVKPYITNADLAIVNYECPVVEHNAHPIEKAGPNLRCTSKASQLLKEIGFTCVTLANNHILDFGIVGVQDTINSLRETGLNYVGAGKNLAEAEKTLYLTIKRKVIAIINCCEHEFSIASDKTAGANPLNPIRQFYAIQDAKQKADYVIVIVHGGIEHYQLPSPRMQETYRFFVDAGASAVVNHHQHCFSGYEIYHNSPIFYGLGNFCFDWEGKKGGIWNKGFLLELIIDQESDNKISFALHPYIQCDEKPVIKMLNMNERNFFLENIQNLNEKIVSCRLAEEHEILVKKTWRKYVTALEPYQNRYFLALLNRRLLPSFISKQKKLQLLDYLMCESHIERLINSLNILKR